MTPQISQMWKVEWCSVNNKKKFILSIASFLRWKNVNKSRGISVHEKVVWHWWGRLLMSKHIDGAGETPFNGFTLQTTPPTCLLTLHSHCYTGRYHPSSERCLHYHLQLTISIIATTYGRWQHHEWITYRKRFEEASGGGKDILRERHEYKFFFILCNPSFLVQLRLTRFIACYQCGLSE